ncbi:MULTISPECIES: glycosyltransferase [Methylobacterium]|uniref:glycosyltransferase n=1 Tax=Methylobacterium TaxID=407 RepID=UPI001045B93E|nr:MULTISPECIES: glycosyltransferase [Methylobacterium]MDR7038966.1 glycosyltransferase involved in cell wall biosynthesis [Methylobacterium sp. BE186]
MLNFRTLQYPFLFSIPILSQASGLRGLFARSPRTFSPTTPIMGHVLDLDPPIFCCQPQPWPFGAAHHFASRYPDEPFVFLTPITMSLERPTFALSLAFQHRRFRQAHPRSRLIVMANTPAEERLLHRLGVDVHLAPQNMFVDESMYHPLPGHERSYDAIYNAQLAPMKRHELARLVPSCAYVTKMFGRWSPQLRRAQLGRFVRSLPQRHVILNEVTPDNVLPMNHVQVNEAMASAHVGLCLSKVEGAMYASIEYLLAGLPVVSTRSTGGRDAFFHPDTTLVVDDDPRSVQDGVAAMKARALPPDFVRATTLRLVAAERERFNTFIDGLRGREARRTDERWSFAYHHKLSRFGLLSEFESELGRRARRSPEP